MARRIWKGDMVVSHGRLTGHWRVSESTVTLLTENQIQRRASDTHIKLRIPLRALLERRFAGLSLGRGTHTLLANGRAGRAKRATRPESGSTDERGHVDCIVVVPGLVV